MLLVQSMRPLILSCLLFACVACDSRPQFESNLDQVVAADLWNASNRGRTVFRGDGFFAIPDTVRRVWIDIGAYKLTMSKHALSSNSDIAVIAIEPMSEHWKTWPDNPRLIGVPVAISLQRGLLELNVNEADGTNSLLKTAPQGELEDAAERPPSHLSTEFLKAVADKMRTLEVRSVPGVRLEDVIERIPPHLTIEFLKIDIQGLDLQALKSASHHLHRVKRVQAEIMNVDLYEKDGTESMSSEQEFLDYMESMGFSLVGEAPTTPGREWLDAFYANDRFDRKALMHTLGPGVPWPGRPPMPR